MEAEWIFPHKKIFPLSISYQPQLEDYSQSFINPFFGYPVCPIIGRYSQGQYKIGETLSHIQFKCYFNEDKGIYQCGSKQIIIPYTMLFNLRTLSEQIPNNRPPNLKQAPDILPEKYLVRKDLNVIWIISFGQLGRDFLNYLNHMYILANTLFLEEKLQRQVHYLPIYAYLPNNSGLKQQQVQKGLNFHNYRGQYMSFHLKKGAPAFSPNNMRLGVQGGKNVTSKQAPKPKKQAKKIKYIQKQKFEKTEKIQTSFQQQQYILSNSFSQDLFNEVFQKKKSQLNKEYNDGKIKTNKKNENLYSKNQKQVKNHQGFIHLYTSVLLEEEYRIYYHWHIQDNQRQDIIKQIFRNSSSIQQMLLNYQKIFISDPLINQISCLLGINKHQEHFLSKKQQNSQK